MVAWHWWRECVTKRCNTTRDSNSGAVIKNYRLVPFLHFLNHVSTTSHHQRNRAKFCSLLPLLNRHVTGEITWWGYDCSTWWLMTGSKVVPSPGYKMLEVKGYSTVTKIQELARSTTVITKFLPRFLSRRAWQCRSGRYIDSINID